MQSPKTLSLLGALAGLLFTGARPTAEPLTVDGVIRADETVTLRSAADGILEEVLVERGEQVKAGQVVARLGFQVEKAALELAQARSEERADLELAKSQLEFAQAKVERSENLLKRGVIEQEKHDETVHDLRLAQIRVRKEEEEIVQNRLELEKARAQWALREIRCPIDGVVARRMRSAGEMVTRSVDSPILEIVRVDPLEVEVRLPVAYYGRVQTGMKAKVVVDEFSPEPMTAVVDFKAPKADAASGTFDLRLSLPNSGLELPAGLRCRVSFAF